MSDVERLGALHEAHPLRVVAPRLVVAEERRLDDDSRTRRRRGMHRDPKLRERGRTLRIGVPSVEADGAVDHDDVLEGAGEQEEVFAEKTVADEGLA